MDSNVLQMSPPLEYEDLINYFRSGEKPKEEWRCAGSHNDHTVRPFRVVVSFFFLLTLF